MFCTHCGARLAANAAACSACGEATALNVVTQLGTDASGRGTNADVTRLGTSADATHLGSSADATRLGTSPSSQFNSRGSAVAMQTPPGVPVLPGSPLAPGANFGNRYHIIRLLGMGGMGAVYQAWDDELGVAVALKVIRPEITADPASARDLERRFKRELLLARQVTHKNVVRIHDLGEIDGIKYITMPYIQGSDLGSMINKEGKLSVTRAVAIAKQVVGGLVAAHEAGVVHRDLKPANIMIDGDDQAVIMDFGIARSVSGGGATVAGAVVGTLEYMAPEQAMARSVDQRADVYAFGLILYDMVLGPRQSTRAESAVAELMARVQNPIPPARGVDPSIPEPLERLIDKCTQPDPAARYQTSAELARDLDLLDGGGRPVSGTSGFSAPPITRPTTQPIELPKARGVPLPWAAGALAVLVLAGGAYAFRDRIFTRSASPPPAAATTESVSLAILPFRNASGDAALDWVGSSIPETLRTEIGQSSSLRTVPPDRLHQILRDLRVTPDSTLDPATMGRLAEWSNADVVLWGQYLRFGSEIRIDATLQDVKGQRQIPLKAQAANEAGLLSALGDLAKGVRENLALSGAVVAELSAKAFRPSTNSVSALKYYNEGLQFAREGKNAEARKKFEASVQEDANFALAFSALANTYATSGQNAEAERFSRQAVDLSPNLPPQEKYLIQGKHAQILTDYPKAIEAYENLGKIAPDTDEVLLNLGELYAKTGANERARDSYNKLLARDPKNVAALVGAGKAEAELGNPPAGLELLNRALNLAIQVDTSPEQLAMIRRTLGDTYTLMKKPDEALLQFQQSLAIEQRLNRKAGIADTLFGMAGAHTDIGKPDAAFKEYEESLKIRREIGDKRGIADSLLNLGYMYNYVRVDYSKALTHYTQALQMYRELGHRTNEALVLNNIGTIQMSNGNFQDARTYFESALTIHERLKIPGPMADTQHNLGVVSASAGDFSGAVRYYLSALEYRRKAGDGNGEAVELYSIGVQYEYQAQFRKAIESHEEALKKLRTVGESDFWPVAVQAQYGSALGQAGRLQQAQSALAEALSLAEKTKNAPLIAQILDFQGDSFAFQNDLKQARERYERALQVATRVNDRRFTLVSRAGLAKVAVAEGNSQKLAQTLRQLSSDIDAIGLKYLAVECSVYLGELLLKTGEHQKAREELENVIRTSERFGLRTLLVRGHFLLSRVLLGSGDDTGGRRHAEQARRLLQDILQENKINEIGQRADLAPVLKESSR